MDAAPGVPRMKDRLAAAPREPGERVAIAPREKPFVGQRVLVNGVMRGGAMQHAGIINAVAGALVVSVTYWTAGGAGLDEPGHGFESNIYYGKDRESDGHAVWCEDNE